MSRSVRLGRAARALRRAAALAAGLGVVAMTLLGAADVAGRFVWGRPLLGQVEIARILMVYVAFLGLAEAERRGDHVRLRLLDPLLSERARALRDGAVQALALAASALVTIGACALFGDAWQAGERMIAPIPLPGWLVKGGVMLGFLLLSLELAFGLLRRAAAWIR